MNVDIAMSAEANKLGQTEATGMDKKGTSDPRIMTPSPSEGVIPPMSASECRNLVRVLVMGAKSVAQSLSPLQQNSNMETSSSSRMTSIPAGSRPSESEIVQVLRDLLYYGMIVLPLVDNNGCFVCVLSCCASCDCVISHLFVEVMVEKGQFMFSIIIKFF